MKQRDIRETVVERGVEDDKEEWEKCICDVSRRRRWGRRQANQTLLIQKNVPVTPTIWFQSAQPTVFIILFLAFHWALQLRAEGSPSYRWTHYIHTMPSDHIDTTGSSAHTDPFLSSLAFNLRELNQSCLSNLRSPGYYLHKCLSWTKRHWQRPSRSH